MTDQDSRASARPAVDGGDATVAVDDVRALFSTCRHDGGFDRELGPIGCRLDADDADGCVCAAIASGLTRLAAKPADAGMRNVLAKAFWVSRGGPPENFDNHLSGKFVFEYEPFAACLKDANTALSVFSVAPVPSPDEQAMRIECDVDAEGFMTNTRLVPVSGDRSILADQYADYSEACDQVRREMRALILERDDPKLSSLYYRSITLSEHEAARRTLLSLPVQSSAGEREATIEECAKIAYSFNAACNSPDMQPFVDAGLVQAVYSRDFKIGDAIRALRQPPHSSDGDSHG